MSEIKEMSSIRKVENKLSDLNLLSNVEIVIDSFRLSRGFFIVDDGVEPQIHISRSNPFTMSGGFIRKPCSLFGIKVSSGVDVEDIMIHEFGHAYVYDQLVKNNKPFLKEYARLFGEIDSEVGSEYDDDIHITEYASSCPDEDFAECFMAYAMLHEYEIEWPGKEYADGVYHKMKFIESLTKTKGTKKQKLIKKLEQKSIKNKVTK